MSARFARLAAWALWLQVCLVGCETYAPAEREHGIFSTCCAGAGTCIPRTAVSTPDAARLAQDTCDNTLLCVPTGLAESEHYVADKCSAYGQIEGRCLPSCLPEVAERSEHLLRDGCGEAYLCVPCFDPLTGERTSACTLGGDNPPVTPATLFDSCCGERGRCIPEGIIPEDKRDNFGLDHCDPNTQSLCVPQPWIDDPHAAPPRCRAHDDAEGRCLSDCLPEVAARSSQLRTDICQPGHKCVPCFDPVTGDPSDACNLGNDAPLEPPHLFDRCCGDRGACVPKDAIEVEDRARVARDSCERSDALCVPREWVTRDRQLPPACRAHGDAEGRCMERCLPEVARQLDRLRQDACGDTQLCVPCFDPFTGEDTGACSVSGDVGPAEPPLLFGNCCGDRGRCVPETAVSEASTREQLDANGCGQEAAAALCVPNAWLVDKPEPPMTCRAWGDAEGRCLPDCLPDVADRLDRLRQDRCVQGERCVPCWNPVTGDSTGACSINGDRATEPPVRFSDCCGELGACVPSGALESDDRKRLDGAECGGAENGLCAPKAWIQDDRSIPDECRTLGDIEGRCLPSCLPDVARRAERLQRETCAPSHLCVPCFDPVTLESTRACNIGRDLPHELPKPFGDCCGGVGRCVPTVVVRESDRSQLEVNSCEQAEPRLCVPEDWVRSDRFIPASCSAPGEIEGRCLPECLPGVTKLRDQLTAAGCAAEHVCVPCFDPVTGEDTRACRVGDDKPPAQAKLFPECCGGIGVCVPDELVDTNDRSQLGPDSCDPSSHALCAPRTWVGDARVPPRSCSAYDGAEGRCLPSCLPEVSSQQSKLKQDVCTTTERCVPCFDPLDGHDTGACHLAGDHGPVQPPRLFGSCCNELGRCLPTPLVSSQDRANLAADSCNASDHVCAPSAWLEDTRRAPPTCRGYLSAEGRCLPQCLPRVAEQNGRLLQDTCGAHHACVPCFDPVSGASTGSCTQPGDTGPVEKARTFDKCCHGGGRCVPSGAIPASDRGRLSKENCSNPADALCVPSTWLVGERKPPVACRAPGNIEGRCLLSCLPEVAKRADNLAQTSCMDEELCVPCYDPLNGQSTGACGTLGDTPREPPRLYPSCCGALGTCVPGDLLDDTGGLNHESCADPESYCVPYAVARGTDPGFSGCSAVIGRGACVRTCFIDPGRRRFIDRDRCQGGELCVPCGSLDSDTAVCD